MVYEHCTAGGRRWLGTFHGHGSILRWSSMGVNVQTLSYIRNWGVGASHMLVWPQRKGRGAIRMLVELSRKDRRAQPWQLAVAVAGAAAAAG